MPSRIITRVNDHIKIRTDSDYIDLEDEVRSNPEYFFDFDEDDCSVKEIRIDGERIYNFGDGQKSVRALAAYSIKDPTDSIFEDIDVSMDASDASKSVLYQEVVVMVKSKKGWMFKNYDLDIIERNSGSKGKWK